MGPACARRTRKFVGSEINLPCVVEALGKIFRADVSGDSGRFCKNAKHCE